MEKINSNKSLAFGRIVEILHTFLVAMGLSTNLLAYTLGNFEYNLIIITIIVGFIFLTMPNIRISILDILFFGSTMVLLLFSYREFNYDMTLAYLGYFAIFSVFALLSVNNRLDEHLLIASLSIILFLCSPLAIYAIFWVSDAGYNLGISYNFLPGFLCSIFLLFLNKTKSLVALKVILWFNILIYSSFYLLKGNRGSVLIIVIYLVIYWFFNTRNSLKGIIIKVLISSLVIYISTNLVQVLVFLNKLFEKLNFNILAIEKTVVLLQQNNSLDSGRGYILTALFNSLRTNDNLLVGKGVGYIESVLNTYSHNLFFQYLFEGGVGYVLLLVIMLLILTRRIIFEDLYLKKSFLLIMFCCIILQLFLSNVYWLNPGYWFLVHYIFTKKSITDNTRIGDLNIGK